jgi:hypothetical protein
MQWNATLVEALYPSDFCSAQPATAFDLYALGTHAHGTLYRAFHRAPICDSLTQLMGNVVCYQLSVQLGTFDLFNVDPDFFVRQLIQLIPQLIDLGTAFSDYDSRTPREDRNRHLARLALNVHFRNRRVRQA